MELTTHSIDKYANSRFEDSLDKASCLLSSCIYGEKQFAESSGWLRIDNWAGESDLDIIESIAKNIRARDDVFILIGVGGSNNAARAVIEAIGLAPAPKTVYAGNSLSSQAIGQALADCKDRDFSINIIAKNFETLEPGIAFRIFRKALQERYGDMSSGRVVATGTSGSFFESFCKKHGYAFLPFPTDIGGRFSALSNVGLLPMAVAGVNVREVVSGAQDMRARLISDSGETNIAVRYAAARNALYEAGYHVEQLVSFEPKLKWFHKWWVQLFGESEGKGGRGIFPVSAEYPEDLHSIGQFLQDGSPFIIETFLDIIGNGESIVIHDDDKQDGFGYLDNKSLSEINRAAYKATLEAHSERLPCMQLTIPTLDAYNFGQIFYFFQFACYLSAKLLGVNPFDQPGVEKYKRGIYGRLCGI